MNSTVSAPSAALRVLLVDDEALACLRLRTLLGDCTTPPAAVVGEAASVTQALAWLQDAQAHGAGGTGACDLVLLDIQMPGHDGTQLAEVLRTWPHPPAVVFVTAHADHALQAFDLAAVDYLTKPVRRERLELALQRVAQRRVTATPPAAADAIPDLVLVVSERGRLVRVPLAEVLYLKAELKYVTLRTATHTHVLDDALSDLEQRLGARFLRVHRNALVARSAIRALERRPVTDPSTDSTPGDCWAVQIASVGEWLAVSRRQTSAVREALAASGL